MIVIVCIEERGGISFHNKRLSMDKVLLADILNLSKGHSLYVSPYTANMLENYNMKGYIQTEKMCEAAQTGDYCFFESDEFEKISGEIEEWILYKWNRRYPYDIRLDETLLADYRKEEESELQGSSHDIITRERYVK